ncbi:MAG TPA: ATP-binding protein [Syntrophorhabdaceae bacterium]|nr:ATP-binding protein [Syntrophorhabdaceae bacterium]
MNEQSSSIDFNIVQSILDFLPMDVYVLNRQRKIQWVNRQTMNRRAGRKASQCQGKVCHIQIFGRKKPCDSCPALETFATGRMAHMELRSDLKGDVRNYLVTTSPLKQDSIEESEFIIETVQDITYQKKADEELRRANDFNAAIIGNAPVAIFTIDKKGEFTSVNPALATLSGLGLKAEGKLLGFNWVENAYTIRCGLAEHIKKGLNGEPFELVDFPFINYRGDQGQYVNLRGVPLKGKDGSVEGLLCIIEDNTEKVTAQMQSIQDAKMSVIGRLLTGVAHELNNPLATIAANSELACELFRDGYVGPTEMREIQKYLDVVQEQAFRCKNIIKDMIDLTKKKGFEVQDTDIRDCIRDVVASINFGKAKITLIEDFSANLPNVRVDLNAMKQCLMNVLHNGVDALEGREGGVIRITARHIDDEVRVAIEDNGIGMHESMLDKIFEPFFSTKATGKGVGLGLTLCYEFLNRMGGNIEVESALGRGSLFRIILPVQSR